LHRQQQQPIVKVDFTQIACEATTARRIRIFSSRTDGFVQTAEDSTSIRQSSATVARCEDPGNIGPGNIQRYGDYTTQSGIPSGQKSKASTSKQSIHIECNQVHNVGKPSREQATKKLPNKMASAKDGFWHDPI
jgi:hypothetical protein